MKSEKGEGEMDRGNPPQSYNHPLSYFLAFLGAIFFGLSNFILAFAGLSLGIKIFFPQCIAAAILFLGYHGLFWLLYGCRGDSGSCG